MSHDDEFRVPIGRIRHKGSGRQVKPLVHRVLGTVQGKADDGRVIS